MINEYGFDNDTIDRWLSAKNIDSGEVSEIKGYAGSAGIAEGVARLCLSMNDLSLIKKGEILVAPAINPAWTAYFPSVSGVVTDIREYQIPAVVATGTATKTIKTGDKLRCDGDTGMVHIIERG